MQAMRLTKASALFVIATLLAGCGTAPGDIAGLRRVLGSPLDGVKGKTVADQIRIDVRVEREKAGGVW